MKIGFEVNSVKEKLRNIKRLDDLINSKMRQRDILKSQLINTVSIGIKEIQVQESMGNVQEDKLIKFVDLENEIDYDIGMLVDLKNEIREKINLIDDMDCQLLLNLRYLEGLSWNEVAEKMGYSLRQVHRVHSIALELGTKCH